jgi:4,5-DOPA dioxygenase extradiol
MDRKTFLKYATLFPVTLGAMKMKELDKLYAALGPTPKMPVLFLEHGSPMNTIEENEFVQGFRKLSAEIPQPNAMLCVSAHWETNGTFVTAAPF